MTGAVRENLRAARFDRHEVAGSLGDLGTFLPLLVGMAAANGLDFASGLFFAGLFNLVTGLCFAIPMAVQPMKAVAAVAITQGLTAGQIAAAGATVSLTVLLLGLTGLVDRVQRAVPKPVVRGLQAALALALLAKGAAMILSTGSWTAPDGHLTGLLAAAVTGALLFSRSVPAALVLFAAGIGIAVWKDPAVASSLGVGFTLPRWAPPAPGDFRSAFLPAALPQIPLTVLNSVVAVCALSGDLFPDRRAEPRRVAVSVGAMNLVGAWFGGMPLCHGAGGLAGQYRFGARTNGSILLLGAAKVALAVLFGASLMALCRAFPASILGVMLAVSGVELGRSVLDQRTVPDLAVAAATAAACLLSGNAALGFGAGLLLHLLLRVIKGRPPRPEGGGS